MDEARAPRVCGDDPIIKGLWDGIKSVLPAYAGMIPRSPGFMSASCCAPRVCGDDPTSRRRATWRPMCSPRMRG